MNMSQSELVLLEYLHEHSGGSGERISLDPKPITRSLRISVSRFVEDSASLVAHSFAGIRSVEPDAKDVPSSKCSAIWITKKGEDFLRLHRKPLSPETRKTFIA